MAIGSISTMSLMISKFIDEPFNQCIYMTFKEASAFFTELTL